jgi:small subunit ribosomal protein S20
MPITRGAAKADRSSKKKRVFNLRRKGAMHDAVKAITKTLTTGSPDAAEKQLPAAYQAIDKAMKRGVIKANTAARKKSRLVAAIKRARG